MTTETGTITLIESMQKELAAEGEITRKMHSAVPNDKWDWRPHPKSMTIKELTAHIAELPTWIGMTLNTSELDFAISPYSPLSITSSIQLMEYFEKCLAEGKAELAKATEDQMEELWTLRNGDNIFLTDPKREMLRSTLSQIIHHRAQLGVYLRLLDIKIPGSYGPSADEMEEYGM